MYSLADLFPFERRTLGILFPFNSSTPGKRPLRQVHTRRTSSPSTGANQADLFPFGRRKPRRPLPLQTAANHADLFPFDRRKSGRPLPLSTGAYQVHLFPFDRTTLGRHLPLRQDHTRQTSSLQHQDSRKTSTTLRAAHQADLHVNLLRAHQVDNLQHTMQIFTVWFGSTSGNSLHTMRTTAEQLETLPAIPQESLYWQHLHRNEN